MLAAYTISGSRVEAVARRSALSNRASIDASSNGSANRSIGRVTFHNFDRPIPALQEGSRRRLLIGAFS